MSQDSGIKAAVVDGDVPLAAAVDPFIRKGKGVLHVLFAAVAKPWEGALVQEMVSCFTNLTHRRLGRAVACLRLSISYCTASAGNGAHNLRDSKKK